MGTVVTLKLGGEGNNSTTKKETIEFSVTRSNLDDKLGEAFMYFYDPIIIGVSGDQYDMKTYGTGSVMFGITEK